MKACALAMLALVALWLVFACAPQATFTPTPGVSATADVGPFPTPTEGTASNACAPSGPLPPPTPTSSIPTPTPTPTPTMTPGGPSYNEADYPPPLGWLPMPELPVPAAAEKLAGAVVSVAVYPPAGYGLDDYLPRADGIAVGADGQVLTVLDYSWPIGRIEVRTADGKTYPASIVRVDPRTGATLLKAEASGLASASVNGGAGAANGEPVFVLSRSGQDGKLTVREGFAGAPTYAGQEDTSFMLLPIGEMGTQGSVLLNHEGALVGMTGTWPWYGSTWHGRGGPYPGPSRPAVKASALADVMEGRPGGDVDWAPALVSYHGVWGGLGWATSSSPTALQALTGPIEDAMRDVGAPANVAGVGDQTRGLFRQVPGGEQEMLLEVVYAQPHELRSQKGKVLGLARWVAFWTGRADGAPDVVLCGIEPGRVGGAFLAPRLGPLTEALEAARKAVAGSYVSRTPLPGYPLTYPSRQTIVTDKAAYLPGEPVRLTVTLENVSDWPVYAYDFPPAIEIRKNGPGQWWQQQSGGGTRTVPAHGSITADVVWPGVDSKGEPMQPGEYHVDASLRTARNARVGGAGATIVILDAFGNRPATPRPPTPTPTPAGTWVAPPPCAGCPVPTPTPTRAPLPTPTEGPTPTPAPSARDDSANLAAFPIYVAALVGEVVGPSGDVVVVPGSGGWLERYASYQVRVGQWLAGPGPHQEITVRVLDGYVRPDGTDSPPRFGQSFNPGQRFVFFMEADTVAPTPGGDSFLVYVGPPPQVFFEIRDGRVDTCRDGACWRGPEPLEDFIARILRVAKDAGRATAP